jgi:hypothetical protein
MGPGSSAAGARVTRPNHVPVVIGHTFTCRVADPGNDTEAHITIVDGDGGFRMNFS